MRSPTGKGSGTCWWSPITTPGGWSGPARTARSQTLGRFFDDLGAERAAALTHVSADGAEFIHTVLAERAPKAVLCLDPFHVVAWATKALG